MSGIWIVFPPWLFAFVVSLIGRWGQSRWTEPSGADRGEGRTSIWPSDWGSIAITNLVFLSLLPISLLTAIGVLLPFTGARAGLSLGLLAFIIGCVPIRLMAASEHGWDRTLWLILIDLLRTGGAMTIVGYLVA